MESVRELIMRFAKEEDPVLITGETGTGKRIVANAIHDASERRNQELVVAPLMGLGDNARGEIFGFRRGAFTSATIDHDGYLKQAHESSLLLDDIPDLPYHVQVLLLRAIEEKVSRPLGATQDEYSDARILAATNQPLPELVAQGKFRMDLYYRLSILTITLPPLREHMEDLEQLVSMFLSRGRRRDRRVKTVTSGAMRLLYKHSWPGNVRELENVIRQAMVRTDSARIERTVVETLLNEGLVSAKKPLNRALRVDQKTLRRTLASTGWNKRETARSLAMSHQTLYCLMKEYGLPRTDPAL